MWDVKTESCVLLVGMWTGAAIMENNLAVYQEVHIELSYDLAASLVGAYQKNQTKPQAPTWQCS